MSTGYTDDRSAGSDEPQETAEKQLIPVYLKEQIDALLSGAVIEKIDNDEQQNNVVKALASIGGARKDLEEIRKKEGKPFWDAYQEVQSHVKMLDEPLSVIQKNFSRANAVYQIAKDAEVTRLAKIEEDNKKAKELKLAQLAEDKLREEEELRKSAKEAEKNGDIETANLTHQIADIILNESNDAAIAATEVEAKTVERAWRPSLMKAVTYNYSAILLNAREVLQWIVNNKEYGYFESETLNKALLSGLNKIAKNKREDYNVPGSKLDKVPDTKMSKRV